MLVPLDNRRVAALDELRASHWHGALTAAEFCHRNERLRSHPYGAGIEHWGWSVDDGKSLVASCDLLPISLGAASGGTESSWLLASTIVPTEERGQSYGTKLMEALLERRGDKPWMLFSDIGPEFYARFGFAPLPRVTCTALALEGDVDLAAASSRAVAEIISEHRAGGRHFTPDEIDWTAERYRAFAEFRDLIDVPVLLDVGAEEFPLFVAVDAVRDELAVLWRHRDDGAAIERARIAAGALGLRAVTYWESSDRASEGTKPEWPMVRDPEKKLAPIDDLQFVDWW